MFLGLALTVSGILLATPSPGQVGLLMPDMGRQHLPEEALILHEQTPPTSGPHYPKVAPWGIYTQEVPEEYWVHNLEHGGIVILYHCPEGCQDLLSQLKETYDSLPKSKHGIVKLLVTPYAKLKTHLALLAWRRLDEMQTFDRERILRFYQAYLDQGPEDVP